MKIEDYKKYHKRVSILLVISIIAFFMLYAINTFQVGGCWAGNGTKLVVKEVNPKETKVSMGCINPRINGKDIEGLYLNNPEGYEPDSLFGSVPWSISYDNIEAQGVIRYTISEIILQILVFISPFVVLSLIGLKIYLYFQKPKADNISKS